MIEQLNLFEQEINDCFVSSKIILQDLVILEERADCTLKRSEAEKLNLIKIYAIRKNSREEDVCIEKDMLNYNLPEGSIKFYSYTDLWRLRFLMPKAYDSLLGEPKQNLEL